MSLTFLLSLCVYCICYVTKTMTMIRIRINVTNIFIKDGGLSCLYSHFFQSTKSCYVCTQYMCVHSTYTCTMIARMITAAKHFDIWIPEWTMLLYVSHIHIPLMKTIRFTYTHTIDENRIVGCPFQAQMLRHNYKYLYCVTILTYVNSSPCISGHIFHAPIPPSLINWPMATSRKNIGTPPIMTHTKYGSRNAPNKKKKRKKMRGYSFIHSMNVILFYYQMFHKERKTSLNWVFCGRQLLFIKLFGYFFIIMAGNVTIWCNARSLGATVTTTSNNNAHSCIRRWTEKYVIRSQNRVIFAALWNEKHVIICYQ